MYFKRIKHLRLDHDLTQSKIAEVIGTSQQMYSDYESGKYDIPNELLLKLAEYYKVSLDYIFERTNDKRLHW